MDNGKCQFLHAHFADDWARCPHPEQVREYKLKDGSTAWYCLEAAEQAASDGLLDSPKDGEG